MTRETGVAARRIAAKNAAPPNPPTEALPDEMPEALAKLEAQVAAARRAIERSELTKIPSIIDRINGASKHLFDTYQKTIPLTPNPRHTPGNIGQIGDTNPPRPIV